MHIRIVSWVWEKRKNIYRFVGRVVGWFIGRVVGWFIGWFIGRFVGWANTRQSKRYILDTFVFATVTLTNPVGYTFTTTATIGSYFTNSRSIRTGVTMRTGRDLGERNKVWWERFAGWTTDSSATIRYAFDATVGITRAGDFRCRGNTIAAWFFSVVTTQVRAAAGEHSGFEWITLRTRIQEERLWRGRGWHRRRFVALLIHAGIRVEARKLSVYTFTRKAWVGFAAACFLSV